jgi:hypothetical protein
MPMTVCSWCLKIIEVKRLPEVNEVSVCHGTNCGEMEMKFRSMFSDHNIGLELERILGANPNERGKQCDPLKPNYRRAKDGGGK